MPAGSEPPVRLPHTWRPLGVRVAGVLFGGLLLVVCAFAWLSFDDETRAKFTIFQRGTLIFLGLLAFSAWYALVRSRVVAEERHLTVVNGYRKRHYEWSQVIGVSLRRGAPWGTLDLSDGTTISLIGVQGSDGQRARRAVREIRAAIAANTPT
jgi:4-amino-4-deoxy-L-arabinose transferase-like glycosyltransferase